MTKHVVFEFVDNENCLQQQLRRSINNNLYSTRTTTAITLDEIERRVKAPFLFAQQNTNYKSYFIIEYLMTVTIVLPNNLSMKLIHPLQWSTSNISNTSVVGKLAFSSEDWRRWWWRRSWNEFAWLCWESYE